MSLAHGDAISRQRRSLVSSIAVCSPLCFRPLVVLPDQPIERATTRRRTVTFLRCRGWRTQGGRDEERVCELSRALRSDEGQGARERDTHAAPGRNGAGEIWRTRARTQARTYLCRYARESDMPRSRRRTREVIGKTPERETTSAAISVLVVSLTRRRSVCTKLEPDLLFPPFGNSFPVRSDSSIRSCSSSSFVRALPWLYCLTSFFRVRLVPWLVRRTVAHDRSHTTRHAPTWLRSAMRLARTPFPLSRSRDASTPPHYRRCRCAAAVIAFFRRPAAPPICCLPTASQCRRFLSSRSFRRVARRYTECGVLNTQERKRDHQIWPCQCNDSGATIARRVSRERGETRRDSALLHPCLRRHAESSHVGT